MIEYGIIDEWNVQMRTSKHNCDHWVVTVETQWLPWLLITSHRELRDYSVGQVAFAVFQALLAITQLLCHVSALLTSTC